jgi:hypothetical protein
MYSIDLEEDKNVRVAVQVKLMTTMAIETFGQKDAIEKTDVCAVSTFMINTDDTSLCIGIHSHDSIVECQDYAKQHTLY